MAARGFFMIDIGRLFSTSFAMMRQRFWLLVGMWLAFLAIQIGASVVLGIVMAVFGAAGMGVGAGLGGGLDNPAALAGLGVGMIVFMVVFYALYIVIVLAQQAAMVTLASPLEEPAFGAALGRGFKSAVPFLGITVLLILAYIALAAVLGALFGVSALAGGEAGGGIAGVLLALLFVPVMVYFGCRFAVLIPVVAVDQVFGPVAAIRRSWAVTRGKVVAILLALLAFMALSLVVLGLPVFLLFGAVFAGQGDAATGVGMMVLGFFIMIPLFIIYSIFASAFTAALHSEVTAGGADQFEEVFA
jgi:membrane-anchored glycerophosphoryl diester phosphodiesterase (GDPDase)